MIFSKIEFNDFRLYKGVNTVELNTAEDSPIALVSGLNGFGKTTFVNGILWCFYGNLIVQVEDKHKREVQGLGGYKKYQISQLNNVARKEGNKNYWVKVTLDGVKLPGTDNSEVTIKREYDLELKKEKLTVLIDGEINKLTDEIGYDGFINDYIISRDIAKFFFFDSEKIVELSDIEREDNKRSLFSAYSRVLGLNEYLELKSTLENLHRRTLKKNFKEDQKIAFELLEEEIKFLEERIEKLNALVVKYQSTKERHRNQLVSINAEAAKLGYKHGQYNPEDLLQQSEYIRERIDTTKRSLNDYLVYLPFAVIRNDLSALLEQYESYDSSVMNSSLNKLKDITIEKLEDSSISEEVKPLLTEILDSAIHDLTTTSEKKLVDSSTYTSLTELNSLLNTRIVKSLKEVSAELKELYSKERKVKSTISQFDRIAKDVVVNKEILSLEEHQTLFEQAVRDIANIEMDLSIAQKELVQKKNKLSILIKSRESDIKNLNKGLLIKSLIGGIEEYLERTKIIRKKRLEEDLLNTINAVSHKRWISRVDVKFNNQTLDIDLYSADNLKIDKSTLSKGEQQLFASSILVALINESSVKFPVLIDSPLQKLDKKHAISFLQNLYPMLGEQILLMPLLDKELQEKEYQLIKNRVSDTYLIVNSEGSSHLMSTSKDNLFENFNISLEHA